VLTVLYSGDGYGNLATPQNLNIYRVTEPFFKDTAYYQSQTFQTEATPLATINGFVPNLTDSVVVNDSTKFAPGLRIRLSDVLGDEILANSGQNNLASDAAFKAFLNGLYIAPDTNAPGDGLVYFDLFSANSKLTLYYNGGQSFDFLINANSASVNKFSHDYTGTPVQTALDEPGNNNQILYLQPLGGTSVRITIPHIDSLKNISINKAELVFTNIGSDTATYAPPTQLIFTQYLESGVENLLTESSAGIGGGLPTRENDAQGTPQSVYKLNVPFYLQNVLRSGQQFGLNLLPFPTATRANRVVLGGSTHLEYRGYDSAGIALLNGNMNIFKRAGKVSDLEQHIIGQDTTGTIGIGHTRWATHGEPNDTNAHPHISESGNITLIHNGIIENYSPLKEGLMQRGYKFYTETDTEVLVNLIDYIQKQDSLDLLEAVRLALNQVVGAYAIVIMEKNNPDQLIAARKGSPLVIGIGNNEFFIASDATPIVEHTKNVVYLNDEELAILTRTGELNIKTIQNKEKPYSIQELEIQIEMLEKGGYDHFMLKEIYEQPNSVRDSMRGRLNVKQGEVVLGGIKDYFQKLVNADRIIIVAEYASEFRYRNPIITEKDVVIAISQSGETADTLAALELAKAKGATILGICNVVGSSIPRLTHAGVYTHAGPEIGVASTKAFTAQVTVLTLISMALAHQKGTISETRYRELVQELSLIPDKIQQVVQKADAQIKYIATTFKDVRNFLYLGRGYNFPVALEGALKLKEISYIHAEGYPAAEMKHGPIALIDEEMPVVVLATNMSAYDKIISNIQEVKARKGRVIAIVTEGDEVIKNIAEFTIEIPATEEALTPLLSSIPLQLLAYHIAVLRGCNVDQPRNLAKSVTVE